MGFFKRIWPISYFIKSYAETCIFGLMLVLLGSFSFPFWGSFFSFKAGAIISIVIAAFGLLIFLIGMTAYLINEKRLEEERRERDLNRSRKKAKQQEEYEYGR